MNITMARQYAKAWSLYGDTCVIFEDRQYSWERANSAIPPDVIIETYHDGEMVREMREKGEG